MNGAVRPAGPADLEDLFAVRREVFVVGQGVPAELETDDLDAVADHVVAVLDGQIVGTGRLVDGRISEQGALEPGTVGTVGTVGRMAVLQSARGRGLGRGLLQALLERATQRGLPAVELHAQVHAIGFYAPAGFVPFGSVYLEAGIEHQGMRRSL